MNYERMLSMCNVVHTCKMRDLTTLDVTLPGKVVLAGSFAAGFLRMFFPNSDIRTVDNWQHASNQYIVFNAQQCERSKYAIDKIGIIVAHDSYGGIGVNGGLPWKLEGDMARFRTITSGHAVVMGRHTWQSLPGPLANRSNIVVTSTMEHSTSFTSAPDSENLQFCNTYVRSLSDALVKASEGHNEVWIIGGAWLYEEAILLADVVEVTEVIAVADTDVKLGYAFFLPLAADFTEVDRFSPAQTHTYVKHERKIA